MLQSTKNKQSSAQTEPLSSTSWSDSFSYQYRYPLGALGLLSTLTLVGISAPIAIALTTGVTVASAATETLYRINKALDSNHLIDELTKENGVIERSVKTAVQEALKENPQPKKNAKPSTAEVFIDKLLQKNGVLDRATELLVNVVKEDMLKENPKSKEPSLSDKLLEKMLSEDGPLDRNARMAVDKFLENQDKELDDNEPQPDIRELLLERILNGGVNLRLGGGASITPQQNLDQQRRESQQRERAAATPARNKGRAAPAKTTGRNNGKR